MTLDKAHLRPPPKYLRLGSFLREARLKHKLSVSDIAKQVGAASSFVYLVEQGYKKPKDGKFGNWAGAYGVGYLDLWKCVGKIPMDLVASLKDELTPSDPLAALTTQEKDRLLPFLDYVRWTSERGRPPFTHA